MPVRVTWVAFVAEAVRVAVPPVQMEAGFAERVTTGPDETIVIRIEAVAVPPLPVAVAV